MSEIKKVEFKQVDITVQGQTFTVTHIPTATSGMWYVIHDALEMWGAVAIDMNGRVAGWRNPPKREFKQPMADAIIRAFGIGE